jgi:hypothetical protein
VGGELVRYAARRDETESEIIEALTDAGYWVGQVSSPGFPDLAVGRMGCERMILLECKSRGGKLTDAQKEFFAKSQGGPRFVVRSAQEALDTAATWIK